MSGNVTGDFVGVRAFEIDGERQMCEVYQTNGGRVFVRYDRGTFPLGEKKHPNGKFIPTEYANGWR